MNSTRVTYFLGIVLAISLSVSNPAHAQYERKGDVFAYWGWNRDFYTKSDYHFKGPGYEFTLYDVVARDKPEHVDLDTYMNPGKLTIPQTNFRIGYFISDHYSISFGFDHMKYVMVQNQTVKIDGHISETGTSYDGEYNHDDLVLSSRFLRFEHTDGLNYLNLELRRFDKILDFNKVTVNVQEGIGIGALVPRTAATFINYPRNDKYHLSGYGISLVGALNVTFFKHFFIQSEAKGGFINMPSVKFTDTYEDKASQSFFFAQLNFVFGFQFNLINPKPQKK